MTTRAGRTYNRGSGGGRGRSKENPALVAPSSGVTQHTRVSVAEESTMVRSTRVQQQPQPIVLEDDDDDVQASSPRTFANARSSARSTRQRTCNPGNHVDPLQSRLGPSDPPPTANVRSRANVTRGQARHNIPASTPERRRVPLTIDLTSPSLPNDDCVLLSEIQASDIRAHQVLKRKRLSPPAVAKAQAASELPKDLFTCPICLETMTEETSTICGHVFCKTCILGAISTQKKCPTCRHKLTKSSHTHRIYLSTSLRN